MKKTYFQPQTTVIASVLQTPIATSLNDKVSDAPQLSRERFGGWNAEDWQPTQEESAE